MGSDYGGKVSVALVEIYEAFTTYEKCSGPKAVSAMVWQWTSFKEGSSEPAKILDLFTLHDFESWQNCSRIIAIKVHVHSVKFR